MPDGLSLDGTILTVGGIDAKVLVDGYEKGIVPGEGPWRKVRYEVAWSDSDNFMDALLGINVGAAPGALIIYPIPHAYPNNTRLRCVGCTGIDVGNARPDPKLLASDFCHVSAEYRVPRWDVDGDDHNNAIGGLSQPYTRTRIRGYTEQVSIPTGGLKTKGAGGVSPDEPIEGKFFVSMPIEEINYTRYMVPYLNTEMLRPLLGKTNAEPMWNRDVGTLLFEDYDTDPEVSAQGVTLQTYSLRVKWRPYDWNFRPVENDAGAIEWTPIWDGTQDFNPYADLTILYRFGLS